MPYYQVVKYVTYYDDLPYYQNSYSHPSHHHSYHEPVSYTIDRKDDIVKIIKELNTNASEDNH